MPSYTVFSNPIIHQLLVTLRDAATEQYTFFDAMQKLGALCAYEIAPELPTKEVSVTTVLAKEHGSAGIAKTNVLHTDSLGLVCMLRAAIPFVNGFLATYGNVPVAIVSAKRGEQKGMDFAIETKYEKGLARMDGKTVIIPDPMLATGSSAKTIIQLLLKVASPKKIIFCSAIASKRGIDELAKVYPNVTIYTAAIDTNLDEGLNNHGYIVPGLGDAGDRSFGTV